MAADLFPRASFDHVGFVAMQKPENAIFIDAARLWVTNPRASQANIEWLWPEPDCVAGKIFITRPHVAYRVENLDQAIRDRKIIYPPTTVGNGFMRVAFIEVEGVMFELIEYSNPAETGWWFV
jgi:hypothetical protein